MRLVEETDVVRKERLFAFALLCFVVFFTICDVYEDLTEGSTAAHVTGEVSVIALCVCACLYLWRRVGGAWSSRDAAIRTQLAAVREDAGKWKAAHRALSRGLSDAISDQLDAWGLSEAEKDISFFLMKGFSFKEIADARKTSEHTVRQQAATVYRKSGLEGRSQLSAFFLEDLLSLDS